MKIKHSTLKEKASQITSLVAQKNTAYGDSFSKCNQFLELLWPHGVPSRSYSDLLTIIRIFDKMMRIANDKTAFNENPWDDILGYALLKATQEEKDENDSNPKVSQNSCIGASTLEELIGRPCGNHGENRWESIPIRSYKQATDHSKQGCNSGSKESTENVCSCSGNCKTTETPE